MLFRNCGVSYFVRKQKQLVKLLKWNQLLTIDFARLRVFVLTRICEYSIPDSSTKENNLRFMRYLYTEHISTIIRAFVAFPFRVSPFVKGQWFGDVLNVNSIEVFLARVRFFFPIKFDTMNKGIQVFLGDKYWNVRVLRIMLDYLNIRFAEYFPNPSDIRLCNLPYVYVYTFPEMYSYISRGNLKMISIRTLGQGVGEIKYQWYTACRVFKRISRKRKILANLFKNSRWKRRLKFSKYLFPFLEFFHRNINVNKEQVNKYNSKLDS